MSYYSSDYDDGGSSDGVGSRREYDTADPTQLTLQRELFDYFTTAALVPNDFIFRQWIQPQQDLFDTIAADLARVKRSRSLDTAEGIELDLHGSEWDRLGRRGGRGDGEYRQFQHSLDDAFQGIGRRKDIEVAVAAAAVTTPDRVESPEYEYDLEYGIKLFDWGDHPPGSIRELADIADPAVVRLRNPVEYWADTGITESVGGTVRIERITTPAITESVGQGVVWEKVSEGLGTGTLDGEDELDGKGGVSL